MPFQSNNALPPSPISTGHLPPTERVRALVNSAYERYKSNDEGRNADYYPALARVPRELFGLCVVGTNGAVYSAGDVTYPFTIMSVSKPFVFALVCQAIGAEHARQKLGVNSTGLPFNSLMAIDTFQKLQEDSAQQINSFLKEYGGQMWTAELERMESVARSVGQDVPAEEAETVKQVDVQVHKEKSGEFDNIPF